MSKCTSDLIKMIKELGTPFTLEVVKSVARLCNEDPYKLWHSIALGITATITSKTSSQSMTERATKPTTLKASTSELSWRCTACSKVFTDVKQLVNHILFFVRQRDKAHTELYKEIKDRSTKEGKTFTQVVEEILRC
ncbi:MAG: hypothetical protein QXL96_02515 [Ignisphaera sp.]